MGRYRKKPVEIEAKQFRGSGVSADEIMIWAFGHSPSEDEPLIRFNPGGRFLNIQTLEGTMRADEGDWVICGVSGEFYPCKPEIFEKTYEPVESEPD